MIGYLEVDCLLYNTHSLKDKRSVLKKTINRIQQSFNVSISELDYQDLWQRTCFGIAHVSSSKVQAERVLQEVLKQLDTSSELEISSHHYEWL
ncbi:hypothetical protein HNQ94_001326 [Salirhabdus euzebyi]|uniref:DUF503 domain-containing protein n=1 Tax=Salirhabdus euzebyi TaxID=394506 RepID=A0A841Q3B1_9BACI|nr:DUF503 family protein [Salirhabdus euzebyi]MBB6452880.1 hypothetical protein [Salirhabdus euzebyi]